MLFMQYENGATAAVISTGYETGAETFLASLTCRKGLLRIDMRGGVHIGQSEKWTHLPRSQSENAEHEALVSEWKAFIHAIETGSPPRVTGDYGKHMIEICLAARESSSNNREIWI